MHATNPLDILATTAVDAPPIVEQLPSVDSSEQVTPERPSYSVKKRLSRPVSRTLEMPMDNHVSLVLPRAAFEGSRCGAAVTFCMNMSAANKAPRKFHLTTDEYKWLAIEVKKLYNDKKNTVMEVVTSVTSEVADECKLINSCLPPADRQLQFRVMSNYLYSIISQALPIAKNDQGSTKKRTRGV